MLHRFLFALLVVAIAAMLQVRVAPVLGARINFLFGVLGALAFFLPFLEFGALLMLGAFLLAWRPGGGDLILFILTLAGVFGVQKFIPLETKLLHPLAVFGGLTLFYLLIQPNFILAERALFLQDLVVTGGVSVLVFHTFARLSRR